MVMVVMIMIINQNQTVLKHQHFDVNGATNEWINKLKLSENALSVNND